VALTALVDGPLSPVEAWNGKNIDPLKNKTLSIGRHVLVFRL